MFGKKSVNVELSAREREKITACIMIHVLNDEKEAVKLDRKEVLSKKENQRLSDLQERSGYYRALVKKINGDPSGSDAWEKRLEALSSIEMAQTSSKPKTLAAKKPAKTTTAGSMAPTTKARTSLKPKTTKKAQTRQKPQTTSTVRKPTRKPLAPKSTAKKAAKKK